jgi:hypothetical protein
MSGTGIEIDGTTVTETEPGQETGCMSESEPGQETGCMSETETDNATGKTAGGMSETGSET